VTPSDPDPRAPSAGRKAAFYAVALVLMGLLAVVGLEIVARILDPIGISFYPETARYMDTLIEEDPIGYRNRPGLEGRFFGAPVRINALGMRDLEVSAEPPPGEYRIAILGDSITFGIGVPYEDSLPAVAERLLQEEARDGVRIRTLNFGVPSYNTEQELIQFEDVGLKLRPNAVVLLFVWNDIYPKKWIFDKRKNLISNLAQRSYAASLLFKTFALARTAFSGPKSAVFEEFTPSNPGWIAIDRSLTALNGRCRAAGIPFIVLIVDKPELPDTVMVRAVGEREGFPCGVIDPWSDPRWQGRDPGPYVNSKTDSHPNREGCLIYGRVIAEAIQRLGGVSAATRR
jgi:hypothetical protein